MSDMRSQRSHAEWDYVHCATAHAPVEQAVQGRAHFLGIDPVVGRPGVFFLLRANERAVLDPRDVVRVGPREKTVRAFFGVEGNQRPGGDHFFAQPFEFGLTAVTPIDRTGLAQIHRFVDPCKELGIGRPVVERIHR